MPNIQRSNKILKTRNENQLKNLEINANNVVKTFKRGNSNFYKMRKSNFNSFINKSITELKNRKSFIKNNSFMKKNTFKLNSQIYKKEEDKTHKEKVSQLLNNAKNFFNNLENILEENKPKEIPYLNANKIYKRLSTVKKKDILFPKIIKNKENDVSKIYGRMYSFKILKDENKNNISNKNNSYMINKSIINNNDIIEECEIKSNNNTNNINQGKKKKGNKSYHDQIIQTFNIQNNSDKDKNIYYEQEEIYNNYFTSNNNNNIINLNININSNDNRNTGLYNIEENKLNEENNSNININNDIIIHKKKGDFSMIDFDKYKDENDEHYKKNEVKIAEIREIYPCYPFNRLINNSTRTGNKGKKYNKLYNDFKNNYFHPSDTRYYYEKFLREIKLSNSDSNDNYFNYYGTKRKPSNNNKIKNVYI